MKNKARLIVLLASLLVLLIPFMSTAQTKEVVNDYQVWGQAELKLDMRKGWAASVQYRIRYTEDVSLYKGSYIYSELSKKLNKHFGVALVYRTAFVEQSVAHRLGLAVTAKQDFGKYTLSFRPQVQYQRKFFPGDDEQSTDSDTYLRTKLSLKRNFGKKLSAYISTEPFFKLSGGMELDKLRNAVGMKYELFEGGEMGLFYMWQPEFAHSKYMQYSYIFGASLDYTIKMKKNK